MQRTRFLLAFWFTFLPALLIAQHPSDVLFEPSQLRTIKLTMAPADWQQLITEVTANTVYRCTFDWDGTVMTDVGVRIKGQSSRTPGTKPSLRFRFNHYLDQKLFRLTRLDAQAMKADTSMLRERLIYDVFRRRGVTAPRAMHVRLEVNGNYIGVYTILDQFDQPEMLRTHFGSDLGNLYKANNVLGGDGTLFRGRDPAAYLGVFYDWEREQTAQPDDLMNLLEFVTGSLDPEFAAGLDARIDVDGLLEYSAINQLVGNEDWLFNDVGAWTLPITRGGAYGHNYYWFFPSAGLRARTIVWDVDVSMSYVWPPEPGGWVSRPILFGFDRSVLGRRLTAVPAWQSLYRDKLAAILDEAFDPTAVVAELDEIYEQIRAAVELDTWKQQSNSDFHAEVARLRADIPLRASDVRVQLGCPGSTFVSYGTGGAGTDGKVALHYGSGLAVLGRSFALRLRNARTDAPAVLLFGAAATDVDLTWLGMTGSRLLVDIASSVLVQTSAQGTMNVPLSLPVDSPLLGVTLYSQLAILDPGVNGPLPVVTTNGLVTHVGVCR